MHWTSFISVLCGCLAVSTSYYQYVSVSFRAGTDCSLKSQWSTKDVISTIEWRYGVDPVVEWNRDNRSAVFRAHLQDRALLDIQTGDLMISSTRAGDSGVYTVFINSGQTRKINVSILSAVPVPTVSWACQPEDEGTIFCVLTCEGDTSGAEPVQYSWTHQPQANISSHGDEDANKTLPKSINVTIVVGSDSDVFVCTVRNTISLQNSQPSTRPSTLRETLHPMKGVVVFTSFIVAVTAAIALHRCWTGVWFFHKESTPWQSDFWRRRIKGGDDSENNHPKELEELKANPDPETQH
ncbi:uncharacterized protein LOC130381475 isoform X1 [Gadus chalcogrammus]|uniref:uncharacterized protein LOC130381475 isoform X1 n=1 Tax=Gadus chalcogrammus TaxID=1042646 RepID=UPI0024C3712D|nr:uncharacterized protein LOC130381475 isoform X1 [Gadus chalcogrammus]